MALGVRTKVTGLLGLDYHELVGMREVETDALSRLMLKRLEWCIAEDDESLIVHESGDVAWNNLHVFQARERPKDSRTPSRILLGSFPFGEGHL